MVKLCEISRNTSVSHQVSRAQRWVDEEKIFIWGSKQAKYLLTSRRCSSTSLRDLPKELSLASGLYVMNKTGKSSMDPKTQTQDYVLIVGTKQKISY